MIPRLLCCSLVTWFGLALAGCGDTAPGAATTSSATTGADGDADDASLRLVTLAPALTQVIVDLGKAEAIVGIAEYDMAAPEGLPVVGNFMDIQAEPLLAVRPTHVMTMVSRDAPPARLRDLAEAGHFELLAYRYPESTADVADLIYHEPDASRPPSLGHVLGKPEQARALRQRLLGTLERLRRLTAGRPRPRTLLVIGTSPIMASAPGTVLDELLVHAGGTNAIHSSAVTAPTFDREALLALQPEVILLLMPEAPPLRPRDERLGEIWDLPIPAVQQGQVALINHPLALLPSTSVPRIVGRIAKVLHPDLADEIDQALASHDAGASSRGVSLRIPRVSADPRRPPAGFEDSPRGWSGGRALLVAPQVASPHPWHDVMRTSAPLHGTHGTTTGVAR